MTIVGRTGRAGVAIAVGCFAAMGGARADDPADITAIMLERMQSCWRSSGRFPNPETLGVAVEIVLRKDGTLAKMPRVLPPTSANADADREHLTKARLNALEAVRKCAPYDDLPPERYKEWRRIILDFEAPAPERAYPIS